MQAQTHPLPKGQDQRHNQVLIRQTPILVLIAHASVLTKGASPTPAGGKQEKRRIQENRPFQRGPTLNFAGYSQNFVEAQAGRLITESLAKFAAYGLPEIDESAEGQDWSPSQSFELDVCDPEVKAALERKLNLKCDRPPVNDTVKIRAYHTEFKTDIGELPPNSTVVGTLTIERVVRGLMRGLSKRTC